MNKEFINELEQILPDNRIKCNVCARGCVLKDGQTGFCGIRRNENGHIKLLAYGLVGAMNIDPIEKKPVLHAFPNANILSISTVGCNFACQYCQNWDISQRRKVSGERLSPEEIVDIALRSNCKGIAYTYNEPTIFLEFARDIGLLARKKGLFNIFVTNGYETKEAVDVLSEFLDFATVDFKGNGNDDFYKRYISVNGAKPIFQTIKNMLDKGIHMELTDLVIPSLGDKIEDAELMINKVKKIAGDEIPISFLRFYPAYKLMNIPETPIETLNKHYELANKLGMKYVYIGNVFGSKKQNTYCPNCKKLLIKRDFMQTTEVKLTKDSKCIYCGYKIPVIQ